MVHEAVSVVVELALSVGFALFLLHDGWFRRYTDLIALACRWTIIVALASVKVLWRVITSLPRTIATLGSFLVMVVLHIPTGLVVPTVGRGALRAKRQVSKRLDLPAKAGDIRRTRAAFIDITAQRALDQEYEQTEEYEEAISRMLKRARSRLGAGQTVLSISLGVFLLAVNVLDLSLQSQLFATIPVLRVIEGYVLLLSLSIIYRGVVMDVLAFEDVNEFDSLSQMEAALRFQQGICFVGRFQVLLYVFVAFSVFKREKVEIAMHLVRKQHMEGYSPREMLMAGWTLVRE